MTLPSIDVHPHEEDDCPRCRQDADELAQEQYDPTDDPTAVPADQVENVLEQQAEARHDAFQQAIAESGQRIAEAAERDRALDSSSNLRRTCCGTDKTQFHTPWCRIRAAGLLDQRVIADAQRQLAEAQAGDLVAGNRDRERFWRDMNPGLAALLKAIGR